MLGRIDMDKLREECGIFGIFSIYEVPLGPELFTALNSLQHRGQDSAGIAISTGKEIVCHKKLGLCYELFNTLPIDKLQGISAIGHVRYSTYGVNCLDNAQPLVTKDTYPLALAYNGNLLNAQILKDDLLSQGINFETTSDSEVILKLLQNTDTDLEIAVKQVANKLKGGFAILIQSKDKLIAIRDANGIRPLCLGKYQGNYVVASESCAFQNIGAKFLRDINPGEIISINKEDLKSSYYTEKCKSNTCAFEYIYFSRSDSSLDNESIYRTRLLAGKELFNESPVDADIVIGVPDSGIPAAIGYSKASGIPYELGFIKNSYVGRTFIAPNPEIRKRDLSLKLNVITENIKNKKVAVIDDSIVRGTTSKKIVTLLREAGAKEVHFLVASPPIKYPCYLGINTGHGQNLIARDFNLKEINKILGTDSINYLSLQGLYKSLNKKCVCSGCFNGSFPVAL